MSKLSFRARALDATKYMPVYRTDKEEIPDMPDFSAINRSVPQMPTGMEKDEESEHHLQRAICAQQAYGHTGELVIPTPEVFQAPTDYYDLLYPENFKYPRQMIHVQPFSIENDIPDYDMDSEDEEWLNKQREFINLSALKFEEIMDRLEKSSGQNVLTINEAKLILKEDDDLIIAVYDYWLNKRLRTQQALILSVKTERRDGTSNNNPYIAFRRRTEKMQTRKNRKNDEASYEKMLKLKRDLSRAIKLIELVKSRENMKRTFVKCCVDVFEKRFQIGDYSGQILAEVNALRHIKQTPFVQDKARHGPVREHKKKREPKRKANETLRDHHEYPDSSDDDLLTNGVTHQSDQEEDDPDGIYAFKRKRGCSYHAPLTDQCGNWPWTDPREGGLGDKRFRYCLTSLNANNPRCIGFARRRVGRGGRIIFDRAWSDLDNCWCDLDMMSRDGSEFLDDVRKDWVHFRPKSPLQESDDSVFDDGPEESPVTFDADGNVVPVVSIALKDFVNENDLLSLTSKSVPSEVDMASFQNHQEELIEMQRKQWERLKSQSEWNSNGVLNSVCNLEYREHSLPPASGNERVACSATKAPSTFSSQPFHTSNATPVTATSTNSSTSTNNSTIPQPSTLDPASVQFAVSAVLSPSEVTGILNSLTNGPIVNKINNELPPSQSNAQQQKQEQMTNNLCKYLCQNTKEMSTDSKMDVTATNMT